jgi:hypothetical protein
MPSKQRAVQLVQAPPAWASHTTLVRGPSGEYNLTAQSHEVKAIVRTALPSILARLCYLDFYPSSATRAAWHKRLLIAASVRLMARAAQTNQPVAARYGAVRERLQMDDNYSPILGRLVSRSAHLFRPH